MSLCNLKEILADSVANRYAVAAFDVFEPLFTESIIEVAEEKRVPVIIMVPEDFFAEGDPGKFLAYLAQSARNATVPVALHLDHGTRFETVMQAIHYGFSSVMIDGSALPLPENVALTRKIVEVAHACGVSVEGEIGHVGGGEGDLDGGSPVDEAMYTTPEEAAEFVKATNVDALAVAIGTVHGPYKAEPRLDFERAARIRESVDIPLVLHGGSGLSDEQFKQCVASGINKINFFTGLSLQTVSAMNDAIQAAEGKIHFPHVMLAAKTAAKQIIAHQIEVFGTRAINGGGR